MPDPWKRAAYYMRHSLRQFPLSPATVRVYVRNLGYFLRERARKVTRRP